MPHASLHRRDIDGLRAVALLPVILFHLNFRYVPGGFLGVDVFFVISGYLITSHIMSELDGGRFSLLTFYERRIRRIVPALAVMLACVSVAAYFLLLPSEMISFQKSLLATLFSVSNFYFLATTSYFSPGDKPLLHTWSLAVEEQFYMLMPLCLALISRYGRRWLSPVLVLAAVASFTLSAWTLHPFPDATFYLLPQRAWELLLGSLFGLQIIRCPDGRAARECFAGLGLITMLIMFVWLPPAWQFPGPSVFLPCLGSGLILAAGAKGKTWAGSLLSLSPLVGIGLISYSAYLWHLPLIVLEHETTFLTYGRLFARAFPFLSAAQSVTMEKLCMLLAASLLCGFLSWRFVEQPIRFGRSRPSRKRLFFGSALTGVLLLAVSFVVIAKRGLPARFSPEVIAITSYEAPSMHFEDGICFPGQAPEFDADRCRHPDPIRPNWLLMGDSLAAHLDYGLTMVYPEVNLMQFTIHGCRPLPDSHFGESEVCQAAYRKLYSRYLVDHLFAKVILSGNWQPSDLPRIAAAITRLKELHQNVVLVGPIMRYDAPLRRLLADSIVHHDPSLAERHRVLAFDTLDKTMAAEARDVWHVPYFSFSVLCPGGHCTEWSSLDVPLQWDDIHLLDGGSMIAAQMMRSHGVPGLTPWIDPSKEVHPE